MATQFTLVVSRNATISSLLAHKTSVEIRPQGSMARLSFLVLTLSPPRGPQCWQIKTRSSHSWESKGLG